MTDLDDLHYRAIAQRFHLELILLFGSRASGLTHPLSDTDIAVLVGDEYLDKIDRLELMGAFVELLKTDRVDVICLNDADYFLRYEATQGGHVLFEARPEVYFDYAYRAMQGFEAHKKLEQLREDLLHEQVSNQ